MPAKKKTKAKSKAKAKTISIPTNWLRSESGGTLLTNDDGCLVAWIPIDDAHKYCLEVSHTPGNYPSFYANICEYDPVRIGQHVVENLGGWYCQKWNLDDKAPIDEHSQIIGED
jgi:hypothetical protein